MTGGEMRAKDSPTPTGNTAERRGSEAQMRQTAAFFGDNRGAR
jgi:hypothetical protein